MTREQAAKILDDAWRGISNNGDINLAYKMAIDTLRGPQPDPDTGLVPCGCGGKAIHLREIRPRTWRVGCPDCGVKTRQHARPDGATSTWNTAMGWKGGAE